MTSGFVALILLTGLNLIISMTALLGVIVVHHEQNSTYDDTCPGHVKLTAEVERLAAALSQTWRYVEAVDGQRPDVPGTELHHDQVGVGH
jgi:hypothetical protein